MKKVYLTIFVIIAIWFMVFYANSFKSGPHSLGQLVLNTVFKNNQTKILFVGDMFFDRYIRQVANSKGGNFIFSCIGGFLKNSDLVIGNLEGPITDNPSKSMGTKIGSSDNYVFTFPTSTAKLLASNNIGIVDLGDNHIGNFGQEGISSTKKYLNEAGVNYFGGLSGDEPIYLADIGGIKTSFISYNEFGGEAPENVAQKIMSEKNNGRTVFVYAHWGDEYSDAPVRVKNAAILFAQSGADFIIGSHPHIVLPSEKIGNTTVYYSLGNFIFDQYWNSDVSTGLVLEMNVKNGKLETIEHKVSLNRDGRTCLVD
jgi:poly-gamma-glutamate synthesis protein (capsule biosynthesis protein)